MLWDTVARSSTFPRLWYLGRQNLPCNDALTSLVQINYAQSFDKSLPTMFQSDVRKQPCVSSDRLCQRNLATDCLLVHSTGRQDGRELHFQFGSPYLNDSSCLPRVRVPHSTVSCPFQRRQIDGCLSPRGNLLGVFLFFDMSEKQFCVVGAVIPSSCISLTDPGGWLIVEIGG